MSGPIVMNEQLHERREWWFTLSYWQQDMVTYNTHLAPLVDSGPLSELYADIEQI